MKKLEQIGASFSGTDLKKSTYVFQGVVASLTF